MRTQPGGGGCLKNACNCVQGVFNPVSVQRTQTSSKKVEIFIKNDKFLKGHEGTNWKEENYGYGLQSRKLLYGLGLKCNMRRD